MSDQQLLERNRKLADWIIRLRAANRLLTTMDDWQEIYRVSDEMEAYALGRAMPERKSQEQERVIAA